MSIRVALNHVTKYRYDRPVQFSPHVIRLRPAPHSRTAIRSYSLRIEPDDIFLNWQQDPYSNYLGRVVFQKPTREFSVTVDVVAELSPINPFDFFIEESAEKYPFKYSTELLHELKPYLETQSMGPLLQSLAQQFKQKDIRTIDFLVGLNQGINERIKYVIRMEPGVQTPEETLDLCQGSCRDSAWLLVQLCRQLGLAARFCSGYLIQLVADEKPLEGPEGPSADFTDLHAWTEVYIPGAGWIGLDPTSGLMAAEGHIPLACTADPQTAAPISGSFSWNKTDEDDELQSEFEFHMSVKRIHETPRVTKPYTEMQWLAIDSLGQRIDADLREWDVRLTMGGEPTFVSIDDRDADEWNTAALGPQKRRRGMQLIKRLRNRFSPQGLLHFGQGKWYPGESLPRWAFGCYWRRDGEAIWADPTLVADEDIRYGFGAKDSERFIHRLAENLGVDAQHTQNGYEDAWYYMWRERRLPSNVDPLQSKLEDVEERTRLARVFEQKLDSIVGHALPIRRVYGGDKKWQSGPWFLRKEYLFLMPGDSPMGFRLPLDSLPWEVPHARQFLAERDPFAPRGPLPKLTSFQPRTGSPAPTTPEPLDWFQRMKALGLDDGRNGTHRKSSPLTVDGQAEWPSNSIVRTAICVEPRHGIMHVFMPPARFIEDYLELIAAVETTASQLQMPVLIEGYRPPSDPRINHLSVTPDPGVIEVNIHPAYSWDECVDFTHIVYEEAKQSRLGAEKFMLDGRHTGTGGGNHIVMGGHSAADSPFLRRPDLLKSMLAYWNNHPSLSYLFSGLFIGPTSQHPRIDEARHDGLRELELAFAQVPNPSETPPPAWLVDRLFRHLLVDVTGNTHRTEFCIDKLYSPDTAEGRRGLLELRSYEMPPHARMSCAQQLLLRSLLAWFWRKPYDHKMVRWGTALHDQFMLPHFVTQDFHEVIADLNERAGYEFDPTWFAPHIEFRFPFVGSITQRGVNLELRTALEPWHVLGEENAGGGTARFVDSSVERLQLRVQGMTDPRHVITCNGRLVPLHPTGTNGEFIAGVRFRAWQPPSCLHPTIGVHAPLVFDIVDLWNERSIGGCTYHVSHPGGRSFDTFPVNALEAESRRSALFFPNGHTPTSVQLPIPERLSEFPLTLDLRQPEPVPLTVIPLNKAPETRRAAISVVE